MYAERKFWESLSKEKVKWCRIGRSHSARKISFLFGSALGITSEAFKCISIIFFIISSKFSNLPAITEIRSFIDPTSTRSYPTSPSNFSSNVSILLLTIGARIKALTAKINNFNDVSETSPEWGSIRRGNRREPAEDGPPSLLPLIVNRIHQSNVDPIEVFFDGVVEVKTDVEERGLEDVNVIIFVKYQSVFVVNNYSSRGLQLQRIEPIERSHLETFEALQNSLWNEMITFKKLSFMRDDI
ncbi:hypothetical protein IEQ34_026885 [Dendrobium chrysotoxum]|uniref:Uncharacterized protein n=1 Tax=Dendrobium chrysotoxum TaxID=161865 RepID=A0AAV7FKR7_DENCH|nr:hypothetical protein IEQ34_026885 [Dendrobium chrysotoxum]